MSEEKPARLAVAGSLMLAGGLVLLWLALWRVSSDAAGWFAPATMLAGLLAGVGGNAWATRDTSGKHSGLRRILTTAGYMAMGLGGLASLSAGSFLPEEVAGWASPVLGRFGGGPALAVLSAGLGLSVFSGLARRGRGLLLDLAMAAGLAAGWIHSQVQRQANFPPPPTGEAIVISYLDVTWWFGVITGGLAGALAVWNSRSRQPGPPPAPKYKLPLTVLSGRWLWRWSILAMGLAMAVSLGLGQLKEFRAVGVGWWRFGLVGLILLAGGWWLARPGRLTFYFKAVGWLLGATATVIMVYFATSEDLEVVLLRNTAERYVGQGWRGLLGEDRFRLRPAGKLAGKVLNARGEPLPGASIVVARGSGQTYQSTSAADGSYVIENVPAGNYLPLAVSPGYVQAPTVQAGGRVATVREGQTARGVDFSLSERTRLNLGVNNTAQIAPATEVTRDNPEPSPARRSSFTFENRGLKLDGGLIHEPEAALGPGPFPILLIVYPGPATSWESVSIPLAAKGYVVISYFPNRLLDLEGDLDDLRTLISLTLSGRLSARGDTSRIALVGGSVSTVYTYLMAQELAGSPARSNFKAAIKYGGLVDLFRYRYSWEQGQVVIDPGISELEYLLVAFGRPDNRPELYLRFSPAYRLDQASLPPTLLVHVNKDNIVPVEQSRLAQQILAGQNIPHQLLLYPDLEHYLDMSKRDPAYADMLAKTIEFLNTYVK